MWFLSCFFYLGTRKRKGNKAQQPLCCFQCSRRTFVCTKSKKNGRANSNGIIIIKTHRFAFASQGCATKQQATTKRRLRLYGSRSQPSPWLCDVKSIDTHFHFVHLSKLDSTESNSQTEMEHRKGKGKLCSNIQLSTRAGHDTVGYWNGNAKVNVKTNELR